VRRTSAWIFVPVAVMTLGVGGTAPEASAAPATGPSGSLAITALYGSTRLAVSGLQTAPNALRVLAAKVILAEAKLLLGGPDPSSPGTVVGGLDLDAYCQSIGDAYSTTPYPGTETPGGAYTWNCVAASGTETPIDMQAACNEQYPGQVTVAYPQDPNNSYSWVCLAPTNGTYSDPATDTTVTSLNASDGDATLIINPDSTYLAVDDDGASATVVQDANGGGYMSFEGGSGGGVSVLVFDGGSGGGVAI